MKIVKKVLKIAGFVLAALTTLFILLVILPEPETVAPLQTRENTQYWQMSMGFRIAYTHLPANSPGDASPIIYLHGGPGGYIHSSTIKCMKRLTALGHDVYLYDQAGSGLSDRLEHFSDISIDYHLRDLYEIITQQLEVDKAILIGHSFGAKLAARFSARHPELVEQIVFSSPGELWPPPRDSSGKMSLEARYPVPDSLKYIAPYRFVEEVNRTAISPKAIMATFGALVFDRKLVSDRQMDRMLNTLATKFTRGMVCDENNVLPEEGGGGLYAYLATNQGSGLSDIRPKLQELDIPILVLHGQCDFIPYAYAYEYAALYPNSRFVFVERAGHIIWWEQPEAYLNAIRAFLKKD